MCTICRGVISDCSECDRPREHVTVLPRATNLGLAAEIVARKAAALNTRVVADFNGAAIAANPGDTPSDALNRYLDRHAAEKADRAERSTAAVRWMVQHGFEYANGAWKR